MVSIADVIGRIKGGAGDGLRGLSEALDRSAIERVCRELGHAWRERELDPATTVALFVQQVCRGNVPCSEVRHLARQWGGGEFTASAYCQARGRLPLAVLEELSRRVGAAASGAWSCGGPRWRGHRVYLLDGSSFSMPDTPPLRLHFGLPGGQRGGPRAGCCFPASHLLVLFDADSGLLHEAVASPLRTGDMARAPDAHAHLAEGDVLLGDEHFGTYAHLALLAASGRHGLFPVQNKRIVDFTPGRPHNPPGSRSRRRGSDVPGKPNSRWVRSLGEQDQLVEWFKPTTRPAWISKADYAALPGSITVRELRRTVARPGAGLSDVTLTMVTTLLDPRAYPADGECSLTSLRLRRWEVETDLRHLKTTMGLDVLRCKTVEGVKKELAVFRLVYNLVRVVMLEAARRQQVPLARVSFADALKWLRHARPGDLMPRLLTNPHRPDRVEPRARKRRPKVYARLNKPRQQMRDALRVRIRDA